VVYLAGQVLLFVLVAVVLGAALAWVFLIGPIRRGRLAAAAGLAAGGAGPMTGGVPRRHVGQVRLAALDEDRLGALFERLRRQEERGTVESAELRTRLAAAERQASESESRVGAAELRVSAAVEQVRAAQERIAQIEAELRSAADEHGPEGATVADSGPVAEDGRPVADPEAVAEAELAAEAGPVADSRPVAGAEPAADAAGRAPQAEPLPDAVADAEPVVGQPAGGPGDGAAVETLETVGPAAQVRERSEPAQPETLPDWGGLAEPVPSTDNLKEIVGIGPLTEARLHALGITQFRQLAAMGDKDAERLSIRLDGFGGRILADDWVGQAQELLARYHSGH
jgi:predicted flap endonuclease-1-like 5' DNA nuclease